MSLHSFAFSDWRSGRVNTTIRIPEVLIGEIIRYALRTLSLAPTCADAQVFFRLYFTVAPVLHLV
ncbi:hypothetical protein C3432_14070 [Citrobacter amalonaticus]|uniref:Uncharacterized protein n=1 Tax=Citrobacter amalonaticus TaxID=35703 RepID=A0A2S4RW67_CITAM|nr:hypothetical protein C3432_14070 [Citrobacter amalonaticus]POT75063.1 hypothetical protein C3436_14540 [Citrobacter amalonaticus]POU64592.1 hypothetical protein C3430_15560 [Citrobacter amalonaticus]POV04428.1 hypothetical protein C3424_14880 [Citrobacter amalonaticus]